MKSQPWRPPLVSVFVTNNSRSRSFTESSPIRDIDPAAASPETIHAAGPSKLTRESPPLPGKSLPRFPLGLFVAEVTPLEAAACLLPCLSLSAPVEAKSLTRFGAKDSRL